MPREMKDSGIEWIGEIPYSWKVSKVKYFFDCLDEKRVPVDAGDRISGPYPYWGAGSITDYVNDYLFDEELILLGEDGAPFFDYTRPVAFLVNEKIWVNNHIHVLKPHKSICSSYLVHYLNNVDYKSYINGSILNKLTQSNMNTIAFVVPPLAEQKAIADFLDRRCAEIDAVIEQTKATIEEYKKLKQSVITEAVTKGIRGNRPMKDSGNIWYGCIPMEWDIRKLKYVFTIKKDIAGKEGYTVLSITQKGVVPKNISSNEGQLAENYSNYQLVAIGDFAMNHMDLLTGWVDISQYEGVTSPDYRVFVLNDTINNCKQYYLYLMQMCYSNRIFYGLGQGVSGMGRWRLQADKFLNFTIPIPPTQEQQEIADYLDQKCAEIDALVTKKEQIVVELEAYKKSLIYEVVTGKKEV